MAWDPFFKHQEHLCNYVLHLREDAFDAQKIRDMRMRFELGYPGFRRMPASRL